jgi:hypothetical protein
MPSCALPCVRSLRAGTRHCRGRSHRKSRLVPSTPWCSNERLRTSTSRRWQSAAAFARRRWMIKRRPARNESDWCRHHRHGLVRRHPCADVC